MSTQMSDHPNHVTIATIATLGREKRMPRGAVRVGKNDPEAIKAEAIRQIEAAHAKVGLTPK